MTPFPITPETTEQDIFNAVVRHAAQMPVPSKVISDDPLFLTPLCAYRSGENNACFIGPFLTDEEAKKFDLMSETARRTTDDFVPGGGVEELIEVGLFPERLLPFGGLFRDVQPIHDNAHQSHWPDQLALIAADRSLDVSVVNEVFPNKQ